MNSSANNTALDLTALQKRAAMKIAVDLAKADRQIHGSEVALLNDCQRELGLTDDELEMIHYLSLQDCISILAGLPQSEKEAMLSLFERVIQVDVDVDARERILLSSIKMALSDGSGSWTSVFSVTGAEAECSSSQIIYLEKRRCDSSREVLDDEFNNLLLNKALNDVGLQLFYLPRVRQTLDVELLCRSMEYILPSGNRTVSGNMVESLANITPASLFNAFCSTFKLSPGKIVYDAFLVLKLQEGDMLDDEGRMTRSIDFICIDVSRDIKDRVSCFVTLLDAPVRKLSYEGYYRLLYDHLVSASSVVSSVRIDSKGEFYLADAGNQKLSFESGPQARTFYLLLLRYGVRGVSQQCFEAALTYLDKAKEYYSDHQWDYDEFMRRLDDEDSGHCRLISNVIMIYAGMSTKEPSNEGFLNYIMTIIKHRSTLKNYLNNGFRSASRLSDKESYCVRFNQDSRSYSVSADVSLFIIDEGDGAPVSVVSSRLWRSLKV